MKEPYMNALRFLMFACITATAHASDTPTLGKFEAIAATEPTTEIVLASEINWEPLNPARGANSPRAGTLWGDRNSKVPTGFLAKFADGFSSPPHIHNVTYRAVVISGLIHNDDPDAASMWMPTGSFWTQPKGEVHITAAKGSNNVALVEIDEGPYRVLPPVKAFNNTERPINIDASNIVWTDPAGMAASGKGVEVAYLWGNLYDGQSYGSFLKLPPGFSGEILSDGDTFRAVIITGQLRYRGNKEEALNPGSYFGSSGKTTHKIASQPGVESIIYIRTNGKYVTAE